MGTQAPISPSLLMRLSPPPPPPYHSGKSNCAAVPHELGMSQLSLFCSHFDTYFLSSTRQVHWSLWYRGMEMNWEEGFKR